MSTTTAEGLGDCSGVEVVLYISGGDLDFVRIGELQVFGTHHFFFTGDVHLNIFFFGHTEIYNARCKEYDI